MPSCFLGPVTYSACLVSLCHTSIHTSTFTTNQNHRTERTYSKCIAINHLYTFPLSHTDTTYSKPQTTCQPRACIQMHYHQTSLSFSLSHTHTYTTYSKPQTRPQHVSKCIVINHQGTYSHTNTHHNVQPATNNGSRAGIQTYLHPSSRR
jgi:hypothetical protein